MGKIVSISDSVYWTLLIRKCIRQSLYQIMDNGVFILESGYLSLYISYWIYEFLYHMRGIWKVLSMVLYLSNRFTNPIITLVNVNAPVVATTSWWLV